MNTTEQIALRMKAIRESLGISQRELALRCGWKSQSRVGNYEMASRAISIDDALVIANALEVSPTYLIFGDGTAGSGVVRSPVKEPNHFPVTTANELPAVFTGDKINDIASVKEWMSSDAEIVGNGFWLRSETESLVSPAGLSVPIGTYVLFDTGRDAENGNLVAVVNRETNEGKIHKLVFDGGCNYLRGLNPSWPVYEMTDTMEIVGVAVETKMRLV
ncbi:helix-turn-helix domain-containing protein [Serratia marcescens]|uniref:helix-turn-helix domain-containing protein n=1 Tax=Serratia marcescens TaxID=615 RepID=UPI001A2EE331|nr:LexA family transcriptional regulator [Serratia marcescens]MBI6135056.1 helix-turn-helix domain-containing protein [Serratia marcescens]